MTRIHETALVDRRAEIDSDVEVGPYSVVGACVKIGKGSRIKSHVVIEGRTTLGEGNVIFQFATIGSRTAGFEIQRGAQRAYHRQPQYHSRVRFRQSWDDRRWNGNPGRRSQPFDDVLPYRS